jgi:nucleoside-diphosphate-sugar epimerase
LLVRNRSSIQEFESHPKVTIIIGSLSDLATIQKGVEDVEVIIHCAALASDWASWKEFYQSNVEGTSNIMLAAKKEHDNKTSLKRVLYVSTADVYGYPSNARNYDESHPSVKLSLPYNSKNFCFDHSLNAPMIIESKVIAEDVVWKYSKQGLPITIVRPANVVSRLE